MMINKKARLNRAFLLEVSALLAGLVLMLAQPGKQGERFAFPQLPHSGSCAS